MGGPPSGIPEADWLSWPAGARDLILCQELASLRERIGLSSPNSSKPPSSDGPGFKPPERRRGRCRKRGVQPGHPGSGQERLPIERVDVALEAMATAINPQPGHPHRQGTGRSDPST